MYIYIIKIEEKMAQLISEGVTGGKFIGYLNNMNPFKDEPIVLELTNISDENTLALYSEEVLARNGVIIDEENNNDND